MKPCGLSLNLLSLLNESFAVLFSLFCSSVSSDNSVREVQEHTEVNIIVDLTVQVCRVELIRVCVFKHTYRALFLKTSSTENIVFVIVKNKLTAFFHCLYFY